MASPSASYRGFARFLHWGMAALVLGMIAAGFVMVQEGLSQTLQNRLFVLHKNLGLVVLAAVLVRLAFAPRTRPRRCRLRSPGCSGARRACRISRCMA